MHTGQVPSSKQHNTCFINQQLSTRSCNLNQMNPLPRYTPRLLPNSMEPCKLAAGCCPWAVQYQPKSAQQCYKIQS